MKRILGLFVVLLCFAVASLSAKDVHVKGYTRKDGKRVASYVHTSPNKTRNDSHSSRDNVNPCAGKAGPEIWAYPAGAILLKEGEVVA